MTLSSKIILGMVLGVIVGLILNLANDRQRRRSAHRLDGGVYF